MTVRTAALVAASLLLALGAQGCLDSHSIHRPEGTAPATIATPTSFYVVLPKDGRYGDEKYEGSGAHVSAALVEGLARVPGIRTEAGAENQDTDAAIAAARRAKLAYVVVPAITHWEDRMTWLSKRPDRLTVVLTLWKVAQPGAPLDTATLQGTSGLLTFRFSNEKPQDLLPDAVTLWLRSIFSGYRPAED